MEKIKLLNINFNNISRKDAVDRSINKIKNREKSYVVTPNSEIAYAAYNDEYLAEILNNANLVLPDGSGVILASKITKNPILEKVAGVDYARDLISSMAFENMSLFILGGAPLVAKTALENLKTQHPNLVIAGSHDGFFDDPMEVINQINESSADVLFVCLGSPKQEIFIYENFEKIDAYLLCGLGGSVDIFAGTAKRAPKIFIKLGLEWFYRLICQPSRITRMLNIPRYLLLVFKGRKNGS